MERRNQGTSLRSVSFYRIHRCHTLAVTLGLLSCSFLMAVVGEELKAAGQSMPHGQNPDIFIDLDDTLPPSPPPRGLHLKVGHGHIVASVSKANDVYVDDDESALASGSGSGSGDFEASPSGGDVTGDVMTATTRTSGSSNSSRHSEVTPMTFEVKEGGLLETDIQGQSDPSTEGQGDDSNQSQNDPSSEIQMIDSSGQDDPEPSGQGDPKTPPPAGLMTFEDADDTGDLFEEDLDAIYDLPGAVSSNHVLDPASWAEWSDWLAVGRSSRVRVRTCQVGDHKVGEEACGGVRLQMRTCQKGGACGPVESVSTHMTSSKEDRVKVVKAPSPPSQPSSPPPPSPDVCQYTLYDTHRHKYVFTRWNLTELITRSKVKKWCDKSSGQYIVMTTPMEHCRGYYRDLCKVSQRCRAARPARERGDFAEGCWRTHVYGDMLPIGLSNTQTIIYFICQRFSQRAAFGKTFGYKQTHFGTLYDTSSKAPVLSLAKISRLGDETWPETDFLIEHGLVENESNSLWFSRRPKKGMLTLRDLDLCQDDTSCSVGLRQVLPQDYREKAAQAYTPTPLMWPELMPPEPAPRIATFTMTNTAPLHKELFQEWQAAIRQVRQFAIQQCGVPVVLNPDLRYQSTLSSHRVKRSELYIASGVSPSKTPVDQPGNHEVWVPFLFWMAGCCVQTQATPPNATKGAETSYSVGGANGNEAVYGSVDESKMVQKVNVTSFSVYLRNSPGNHVISAPVLQLELLLQDIYRATPSDPDVTLFPGHESGCSELQRDVSGWFQK